MQAQRKNKAILPKGAQVLMWLGLSPFLLFLYFDPASPLLPQWLATLFIVAMDAIPTYYAANKLVPQLLYKKQIRKFVGLLLLMAAVNTVITYLLAGGAYFAITGHNIFTKLLVVGSIAGILFGTNCIVITLGCAIKIIVDRFQLEEQLHEVQQEQISTELAFLRAQINPHFLFNVINTIYFQIHKENKAARGSVEKLSEMLRYQLYECTTDRIDIVKELAYIENYVAVQQLRMEPGTDVQLHLPTGNRSFKIAPLLILPIVENAFKHISHYKIPSSNKLHVTLSTGEGNQFMVQVSNTYDPLNGVNHVPAAGGLGLQNVKRRLELLYPVRIPWMCGTANILLKPPLKFNTMINCLIVDDEPIAREGMLEHIRQVDYLNPVAQCKSAIEAAGMLQKASIDLIFIDIQMPRLTGIEFVKALAAPPLIIFTTAYSEYALEGFELDVVDYLLKPISFPRFLKAAEKAQSYLHARDKDLSITNDFFFIKCNGKIEKIVMADVQYIEGMANYVVIHAKPKKYITYLTFSGIEEQLPAHLFVRIHKSYLVAISAIQTIDGSSLTTETATLPISKNYKNEVMNRIERKLLKR